MRLVTQGIAHEAFTHETEGTFDVTEMRTQAQRGTYGEVYSVPLTARDVKFLMENRDWDPARVRELLRDPRKPFDTDPALAIFTRDEKHLFCDGIHRIIARWQLKRQDFQFYLIPIAIAPRPDSGFQRAGDWGKIKVGPDGKLYHRDSGLPFTGTEPPT